MTDLPESDERRKSHLRGSRPGERARHPRAARRGRRALVDARHRGAPGRSKSEIFRMVFVLQQRGYLVREAGTDRLALSRRLFDLGIRTPSGRQLTSVVLPLMERFSEESGQAAHLVVLSRAQTVVLATTSGHLDASVIVRPGYGRPALDANSGLLILAFQSEARRRPLMKEAVRGRPATAGERGHAGRTFAEIRAQRPSRRAQPRHHGGDRHRLPGDRAGRLCRSGDPGALPAAPWRRDGRAGDPAGAGSLLPGGRFAAFAVASPFDRGRRWRAKPPARHSPR